RKPRSLWMAAPFTFRCTDTSRRFDSLSPLGVRGSLPAPVIISSPKPQITAHFPISTAIPLAPQSPAAVAIPPQYPARPVESAWKWRPSSRLHPPPQLESFRSLPARSDEEPPL